MHRRSSFTMKYSEKDKLFVHITVNESGGNKRKPIKKRESDINSAGGWYILSNHDANKNI